MALPGLALTDDISFRLSNRRIGDPASAYPNTGYKARKHLRIGMGLDSLIAGAGGTDVRDEMGKLLTGFGPILIPPSSLDDVCSLSGAANVTFSSIAGRTPIGSPVSGVGIADYADARRTKAWFGQGSYWNNTASGTYGFYDAAGAASTIIGWSILVEFTAAGQSLAIKQFGESSTNNLTVSGDAVGLNTPTWVYYPMTNPSAIYKGLAITAINTNGANDIFIYAKAPRYPESVVGVQIVNLAQAGSKTSDWAKLTVSRQEAFAKDLNADFFILNGGTNDIGSVTESIATRLATTYMVGANLEKVASWMAACPNTRIMLTCPHERGTYANDGMDYLPDVVSSVAERHNWAYQNDKELFGGSYTAANAAGYMNADATHPLLLGNQRRAAAYVARLGLAA